MASDKQNGPSLGKETDTDGYRPNDLAETIDDSMVGRNASGVSTSETDDDLKQACNKTLSEERFDAEGVLKTVGELAETVDDDRADLAHNILTAKMRANETGEQTDFNIISDDDDEDLSEAFEESLPGRYDIVSSIGSGGQGQVFEAFDNNFKRFVAVKFPAPEEDRYPGTRNEIYARSANFGFIESSQYPAHI